MAADLIIEPVDEVAMAHVHDWNGAYIGGFAGWGAGTADWDNAFGDVDISGFLAGVDLGVNFQTDNLVFGIEGDAAWSGIGGSVPCTNPAFTCTTDVDWLATLRGRAGIAAGEALFYLTAGLAVGQVTSDSAPFTPGVTFSNTQVGWTAGAGAELAVTEDMSLKAEYLYVDLGSATDDTSVLGAGITTVAAAFHTVKVGLNWHF
jgi:outer membrane immunogenic protein